MRMRLVMAMSLMILLLGCTADDGREKEGSQGLLENKKTSDQVDTKGEKTVTEKDCGSDMACYASSLQSCTPAKHYVSEGDQFAQMKILGPVGDVCEVEWNANQGEMLCKIPLPNLTRATEDDVLAGNFVSEICTGSLADAVTSQFRVLS